MGKQLVKSSKPVVELRQVTKMYGSARGVEDITFRVEKGMVFGFLGPNGSGKSTTINMLLDFIRPTKGSINILGQDAQADSVAIHSRIGFLAGDMAMDRGLTGWQQLEYLGNLRGNFDKRYVHELAKRLECKLDRKFKTLSRGNKQKVGLIAALMHKPELLILDEPTTGLDPIIQAEFNVMLEQHKVRGGTTFISSHVLSEIQEICDIVTFIRDGKLVATKPVAEIASETPKELIVTSTSKELHVQLKKLEGLTVTSHKSPILSGTYSGDVNELIKLLARYKVASVTLAEADLETSFMKYYKDTSVDA